MSTRDTLDTVSRLIHEVMGDDGLVDIDLDTSFSDDLELESIEFVALAEAIQGHYGARVDFTGWLAGHSLDALLALRVGDLVAHIDRCLGDA
jgi:acyl carrier protein